MENRDGRVGEEMNTFFFGPRAPRPRLRVRGVGWLQQGEGHCSERDVGNDVVVSLNLPHLIRAFKPSSFPLSLKILYVLSAACFC